MSFFVVIFVKYMYAYYKVIQICVCAQNLLVIFLQNGSRLNRAQGKNNKKKHTLSLRRGIISTNFILVHSMYVFIFIKRTEAEKIQNFNQKTYTIRYEESFLWKEKKMDSVYNRLYLYHIHNPKNPTMEYQIQSRLD